MGTLVAAMQACCHRLVLAAAGVYPPSASPPIELSQTESAIASATQALAIMRNATVTGQVQGSA